MAEVKVNKPSQEKQSEEQRGRGLARRSDFPSLFMMSPREFFQQSPFSLMRRFSEEMDRAFGGFFREPSAEMPMWAPAVEVREHNGSLVVYAELPGLNKDDVKVEATEDGLVIRGERKREHEEKREGMYRSERSYGQFYRLIPLPEGANLDQVKATFNNGILEITIPVAAAEQKRREIPIETGEERARTSGGGA